MSKKELTRFFIVSALIGGMTISFSACTRMGKPTGGAGPVSMQQQQREHAKVKTQEEIKKDKKKMNKQIQKDKMKGEEKIKQVQEKMNKKIEKDKMKGEKKIKKDETKK